MGKSSSEIFPVTFIGLPDEFRRAHQLEIEGIAKPALWLESLDELRVRPAILVLNLDGKNQSEPAFLESVRSRYPRSELIAVSGRDSAQFAMQCLRHGFSDFLTQPVSPDELTLCLLRAHQRQTSVPTRIGELGQALSQIQSCTSTAMLRLRTLSSLKTALSAEKAEWSSKRASAARPCATSRRVTIPCRLSSHGHFIVTGLSKAITAAQLERASAIAEQAELTLMNLRRVEKLKEQTFVDDLTGLYNSRYLRFALESAALQFERNKEVFALMFVDIDRFKLVNDEHGHLVGSDFLKALGKIFKNAVRERDLVFRYGGDEFVLLLRNTPSSRALSIAERLRSQIEKRSSLIRGIALKTTVSIGVACFPEQTTNCDRLIQLADEAMYRAKRGRNRVEAAKLSSKSPSRPPRKRPVEPSL